MYFKLLTSYFLLKNADLKSRYFLEKINLFYELLITFSPLYLEDEYNINTDS